MKANRSETWEKIMAAGKRAASAYREMVRAADELADVVEYNEDYVLRRVLPRSVAERRESERILDWLNGEREEIEAHVLACQVAREKAAQREALLARLNLSAEEQRLLGISKGK